ncbi:hypothetical protein NDA16_002303 [Ustilago loliicola]|nr:hypothetical protein NDA16_002303 [Ustilago loliicola]
MAVETARRKNNLKIDVAFHFEDASGKRRDNVTGDLILQSSPNSRQPTPFIIDYFAVHISAHVLEPTSGKLQRGRQGTIPLIQFGPARERGAREPVQPATLRAGGNITKDATGNEQASARTGNIAASHAGASHKKDSGYEQNRRSTRFLLAANNSGSNTIADADNESEADNEDVCSSSNDSGSRSKVMDIRSVL